MVVLRHFEVCVLDFLGGSRAFQVQDFVVVNFWIKIWRLVWFFIVPEGAGGSVADVRSLLPKNGVFVKHIGFEFSLIV